MHSCVAVHAVLSTSADICVIIKHTTISWTNLPRESNTIAVSLTEAGGQSATRAYTCVLITNAVTVITTALVLIRLVVETMHFCVAVHVVLSTSADVCVVINHTVIDWTNRCRDNDTTAVICTEAGGGCTRGACTGVPITNAVTVTTHTVVMVSTVMEIM